MRQMQITCSSCAVSSACRCSLEAGEARQTFRLYCPNTYAIAALQGGGWWLARRSMPRGQAYQVVAPLVKAATFSALSQNKSPFVVTCS
jgi:hypothetical protein